MSSIYTSSDLHVERQPNVFQTTLFRSRALLPRRCVDPFTLSSLCLANLLLAILTTPQYVQAIQTGTEPFVGSADLNIKSFSVEIQS